MQITNSLLSEETLRLVFFSRSNQVSGHIFLQDKLLLEKVQFATFFFIFSLMLGFLFKGSASNDFSLPIYLQLNINSFSVDSCDMSFVYLPLIMTVQTDIKPTPSEYRTYLTFRKAPWAKFYVETERIFETVVTPSDVHQG